MIRDARGIIVEKPEKSSGMITRASWNSSVNVRRIKTRSVNYSSNRIPYELALSVNSKMYSELCRILCVKRIRYKMDLAHPP